MTITQKYFVYSIVDANNECIRIKQCRNEGTFTFRSSKNDIRFVALNTFCDLRECVLARDCVEMITRDTTLNYEDECEYMIKQYMQ